MLEKHALHASARKEVIQLLHRLSGIAQLHCLCCTLKKQFRSETQMSLSRVWGNKSVQQMQLPSRLAAYHKTPERLVSPGNFISLAGKHTRKGGCGSESTRLKE